MVRKGSSVRVRQRALLGLPLFAGVWALRVAACGPRASADRNLWKPRGVAVGGVALLTDFVAAGMRARCGANA
jgi:hypothetical protein